MDKDDPRGARARDLCAPCCYELCQKKETELERQKRMEEGENPEGPHLGDGSQVNPTQEKEKPKTLEHAAQAAPHAFGSGALAADLNFEIAA